MCLDFVTEYALFVCPDAGLIIESSLKYIESRSTTHERLRSHLYEVLGRISLPGVHDFVLADGSAGAERRC